MTLHHVSLEVRPADVQKMVAFWSLVGFEQIEAPEPIASYVTWLEAGDRQIHLIQTEAASVPALGHAAIVAPDFDQAVARLREAGIAVDDAQELWGAPRAFARAPGGHRVELMGAPPPPA
jgi:catechol 2,3-dioxygenase-like lactoylglutathione lyase family enzyme